jgi:hypothetical protein
LPFVLYVRASRGDLLLLRDRQVRAFALAVLVSTVILTLWLTPARTSSSSRRCAAPPSTPPR